MTNIDSTTGLPALPENHYWEIREVGGRLEIFLMESVSELGTQMELVERKGTWRTLWIPYTEKAPVKRMMTAEHTRESSALLEYMVSSRPEAHTYALVGWSRSMLRRLETDMIIWDEIDDPNVVLLVRRLDCTEENILKIASMMLGTYERRLERNRRKEEEVKRRAAFVGKYPPKVLKVKPDSDNPVNKKEVKQRIAAHTRKLKDLQEKYASGNYSGHPEEMLGDIDNEEFQIKKLKEKLSEEF